MGRCEASKLKLHLFFPLIEVTFLLTLVKICLCVIMEQREIPDMWCVSSLLRITNSFEKRLFTTVVDGLISFYKQKSLTD